MLRALGMDWSSFFSKVAPVTVLRGRSRGAQYRHVSLTAASFIVTRSCFDPARRRPRFSTVAKPSRRRSRSKCPARCTGTGICLRVGLDGRVLRALKRPRRPEERILLVEGSPVDASRRGQSLGAETRAPADHSATTPAGRGPSPGLLLLLVCSIVWIPGRDPHRFRPAKRLESPSRSSHDTRHRHSPRPFRDPVALGAGGMGEVYRAKDPRSAARWRSSSAGGPGPGSRQDLRFEQEARAARR
jgi:hypothetical protein